MTVDQLGLLALRWAAARREERRAKLARWECSCERAEPVMASPADEVLVRNRPSDDVERTQEKPCWKIFHHTDGGDDYQMPREQWCSACLQRQKHHDALRLATRHRAALQRAMLALAKRLQP